MEQEIVAPETDDETERATENCKKQPFEEQLAHDTPPRRAECQTKRDFLRPSGSPGQQHVREIQACHEKAYSRHAHPQSSNKCDRHVVPSRITQAESRWSL